MVGLLEQLMRGLLSARLNATRWVEGIVRQWVAFSEGTVHAVVR
jgi:hypothetical protein